MYNTHPYQAPSERRRQFAAALGAMLVIDIAICLVRGLVYGFNIDLVNGALDVVQFVFMALTMFVAARPILEEF